jgi:hypothetical protein
MSFTENWIQSLTLAAKVPAAQRVKPLVSDVDAIGSNNPETDRLAAATRLWEFANTERLLPFLDIIPSQCHAWKFEDDESFIFEAKPNWSAADKDSWLRAVGVVSFDIELTAEVNKEDWYTLIRREMVRNGRSFNANALPDGTLLKLPCQASWDTKSWSMKFENPSWLAIQYESGFFAPRPAMADIEDKITMAIIETIESLKLKSTISNTQFLDDSSWIQSIEKLAPLHNSVLLKNDFGASPQFRRTWACVWPVVYREQNKLKGENDVNRLRKELEYSFQNGPRLTLWLFVFAKLICKMQTGTGLGACGEFRDL